MDKITISFDQTLPHIKCQNPDCDAEFILLYATMDYNEDTCKKEPFVLEQGSVSYCPYCGKKQKDK